MLKSNFSGFLLEAGADEAGRGCLAGPVTCASILLPEDFKHPYLNDSKQLTEKQRFNLRPVLEAEAIDFKIIHISPQEIDQINILKASISGMQQSLLLLNPKPEYAIIDGNRFSTCQDIPYSTIVKGDSKFMTIAAASVLAKTYRDEIMEQLHLEFPMYAWDKNKGYPTKAHRKAIAEFGPSPHHRMSFRLLPEQLTLFETP